MARLAGRSVVVAANAWNLLLIGVFLARAGGAKRLERRLGLTAVALALPLAVLAFANALALRPWWTVALPLAVVAYLLVELILDYILALDFRSTRFLGPYLLLFTPAQATAGDQRRRPADSGSEGGWPGDRRARHRGDRRVGRWEGLKPCQFRQHLRDDGPLQLSHTRSINCVRATGLRADRVF